MYGATRIHSRLSAAKETLQEYIQRFHIFGNSGGRYSSHCSYLFSGNCYSLDSYSTKEGRS